MVCRRNDRQLVPLARVEHRVPQRLRVHRRVPQEDLVALLPGEPGLGDDHVAAGDRARPQPVGRDVRGIRTDQVDHQVDRLRTLQLHRADVDLLDRDVEALAHVDALQPEHQVGVGHAEPELVLRQPQQHRVVEDAARLVAQDHVASPHRRDLGRVPGDHEVDERLGVRALDLDLPLDGDVPHRDMVDQRVVLGVRPTVGVPDVAAGVVDAVVYLGPPAARLHRQVPVRRLADSGADQQLDRGRAGLPEVDRDGPVRLVDGRVVRVHVRAHATPPRDC